MNYESHKCFVESINQDTHQGHLERNVFYGIPDIEEFVSKEFPQSVGSVFQDLQGNSGIARGGSDAARCI